MSQRDPNLKRRFWLATGSLLAVIILIAGILIAVSANTSGGSPFPLKVSGNHRYLVQRDGVTPYYPPAKPTWNMEPNYEGENGNTPYNVRLAEGWSALSGAFGVSYGSKVWRVGSVANWQKFLDLPGTTHFTTIAKAIQSRAFEKLAPDQDHAMLTAGYGSEGTFASAALADDGSFGMAYLPDARPITIDMAQFNGDKTIKWFDPTNNSYTVVGIFPNRGTQDLPAQSDNSAGQSDWILIVE